MPGCGSSANCDCFIVDPIYYGSDDLRVTKQNHTIIHGDGSENNPFYVENIFAQNFLPPAVKLRTTVAIPTTTTMFVPFEIADVNIAGMWVPYDNTKISIQYSGYYVFGASILWNEKAGSAGANIELGLYVGTGTSPLVNTNGILYQQSIDENPNTLTHKTTGQTVGSIVPGIGIAQFKAGTVLRVGLVSTVNIGATQASFWCCYV